MQSPEFSLQHSKQRYSSTSTALNPRIQNLILNPKPAITAFAMTRAITYSKFVMLYKAVFPKYHPWSFEGQTSLILSTAIDTNMSHSTPPKPTAFNPRIHAPMLKPLTCNY